MNGKPHIHVAIPTPSGNLPTQLIGLVSHLVEWRHAKECPYWFSYELLAQASPVEYARNLLVKGFLAGKAELLWFIDYDLIPPENWKVLLEDSLSGVADIVAGKYANVHRDEKTGDMALRLLAVRGKDGLHPTDPDPFVDGAATGCMIIPRRVFEDERMRLSGRYIDMDGIERDVWDEVDTQSDAAPPFFRTVYDPSGRRIGTEDYEFCRRARALGYTLRLSDVWWDHVKPMGLLEVNDLACRTAAQAIDAAKLVATS